MGDHCILNSYDKLGGRHFYTNTSTHAFQDFVKHYNLTDLGFSVQNIHGVIRKMVLLEYPLD